jgi:predicted alpha/beta superfamily hydrolase
MTVSTGRASGFHAADAGAAMISASERFHVQAEGYAQPFRIDIALPAAPVPPGQTLPVIYVLDGNWSFAITAQIARALTIGPDGIPPAIVVGVGYAIDGPAAFGATAALRYRDLAHGVDEKHIAMMREMIPPALWPDAAPVGKSDRFSRFIEEQLKPFIEARYPVDASNQTLLGVSLGGLFVLRTLFTASSSFSRYIAVSPSIWWNCCEVLDAEAKAVAEGHVAGSLFMGVGSDEHTQAPEARMVMNLVEMAARLRRGCSSLKLTSYIFPDEGHMSVPPAGISRGLRAVFAA